MSTPRFFAPSANNTTAQITDRCGATTTTPHLQKARNCNGKKATRRQSNNQQHNKQQALTARDVALRNYYIDRLSQSTCSTATSARVTSEQPTSGARYLRKYFASPLGQCLSRLSASPARNNDEANEEKKKQKYPIESYRTAKARAQKKTQ